MKNNYIHHLRVNLIPMNQTELAVFHSFNSFPEYWLSDDFIKDNGAELNPLELLQCVIMNIRDEMNDGQEEFHEHTEEDLDAFILKFNPQYLENI